MPRVEWPIRGVRRPPTMRLAISWTGNQRLLSDELATDVSVLAQPGSGVMWKVPLTYLARLKR
jgi:hypothetical protein